MARRIGRVLEWGQRVTAAPTERHDKPSEPEWKALHRIQDRATPRLRRAFLRAVAKTQSEIVYARVVEALDRGDIEAAVAAIRWEGVGEPVLKRDMLRILRDIFDDAGGVSAALVKDASFSVLNPRGLSFMAEHGAELVTNITDATVAGLRQTLADALAEGLNAQQAARLVKHHVGLTPRFAKAVGKYRSKLVEQGMTKAEVDKFAQQYAAKLNQHRAMTIARTESAIAATAGQHEAWEQAAEQGLFDRATAKRVWITTPDDLADHDPPSCSDFDGAKATMDGSFSVDGYSADRPPLHPGCRCAVGLEVA